MRDHILDCCSLLNLYTGWRGLEELRELGLDWHICEAVVGETEYTREYDGKGGKNIVPVDISRFLESGMLNPVKPKTDTEFADYVSFAMEIDDGEAQAIAIAKCRNYVLLTDDRRAANFARRRDVGVRIISTPEILKAWADRAEQNEERLFDIIPRIAELAKYSPAPDAPLSAWWLKYNSSLIK
jgi:hypothetical protein